MSKKSIFKLNQEIAAFIKEKDAKGEAYSLTDVEYINQYKGDGGLASAGAESRGLLYEYYTPDTVISYMWGMARQSGFTNGKVLEPSCGTGRFLRYADPDKDQVVAYEYNGDNNISARICEITYPWATVRNEHFESIFYTGNKRTGHPAEFDLVIGNPPYGDFTGKYAGKLREGKIFKGYTYDQYFIWAGLKLLKPGGVLVMIVPSSLADNRDRYVGVKGDFLSMAMFVQGIRMPYKIFETTEVQTDILVFKKEAK